MNDRRPPFRIDFHYREGDSTLVFLVNTETKESWALGMTNCRDLIPIPQSIDFSTGEFVCSYAETEKFA